MLPRKHRVKTDLLPVVFKKSQVFSSDNLILRVNFTNKVVPFGLAVIIPAKTVKKSTSRHLVKRRIHSIVGKNLNLIKDGVNLVLQIKSDLSGKNFKDLESELIDLFKKAGILN